MLLKPAAFKKENFRMRKNTAVFGIYTSRFQVDEAVDTLRMGGFRTADISALFPHNAGDNDFGYEKSSKAPEGAAAGMGAGAALGGALGWLAGIRARAVDVFCSYLGARTPGNKRCCPPEYGDRARVGS